MVVVIATKKNWRNLKLKKGGYYKGTFGVFLMTLQILCFNLLHIVPKGKYLQDIIKKNKGLMPLLAHPLPTFKIT